MKHVERSRVESPDRVLEVGRQLRVESSAKEEFEEKSETRLSERRHACVRIACQRVHPMNEFGHVRHSDEQIGDGLYNEQTH